MTMRVCLAGATGWAGSALARGIGKQKDMELVAAISRTHAGEVLGDVLEEPLLTCMVFGTVEEALAQGCDVLVEYTSPEAAKLNILAALEQGAHVVVGTSGLTDGDYAEIDGVAQSRKRGVLACGNFALTFALLERFAESAARLIPQWEIIDYGPDTKTDAPSGTARELAFRLSQVDESGLTVPLEQVQGEVAARGARVKGSQIHAVRLPGMAYETEIIFGMADQKLVLYHRAGSNPETYVEGGLIAIRKGGSLVGLRRGLDTVMEF